MKKGSKSSFVTLAELRKLRGITIPQVRMLEKNDVTFPSIAWTGSRQGLIVLEEYDLWFSKRDEQTRLRREGLRRRKSFVSGRGPENTPRFKRGDA